MGYDNKIHNNELTEMVFNKLVVSDVIVDYEFDIDDIITAKELDDRPILLEGVVKYLNRIGIEVQVSDTDTILKEVRKLYKERLGIRCPKTVEGWLKGTEPSVKERKNNYSLCYALKLSLEETAEFFLKYFLTVPFNYKDTTDAIYFYCLYNNKSYDVIEKMMDKALSFSTTADSATTTLQIHKNILEIDNDDEFTDYIKLHCYNNEAQYQVARRKINDYMEGFNIKSMTELHEHLMAFNYQSLMRENQKRKKENKKLKWKKNIELPKRFYESLPTEAGLEKIKSGDYETYETLRKILIILILFDYYGESFLYEDINEDDVKEYWDDFYETVNDQLIECGFAPLYVRHPFDWLILFCANSTNPVEVFRELSNKRFTRQ